MRLFTRADSRIPTTSTVDMSTTMSTAGRLMMAPVKLSPECAHSGAAMVPTWAAVHHAVGDTVSTSGR